MLTRLLLLNLALKFLSLLGMGDSPSVYSYMKVQNMVIPPRADSPQFDICVATHRPEGESKTLPAQCLTEARMAPSPLLKLMKVVKLLDFHTIETKKNHVSK